MFGYNEEIWDGKVAVESLDFDKLSTKQQDAASLLGYNKESLGYDEDQCDDDECDDNVCNKIY